MSIIGRPTRILRGKVLSERPAGRFVLSASMRNGYTHIMGTHAKRVLFV